MADRSPTAGATCSRNPSPEELEEQAEEVREMRNSKGWKIVESWINHRIKTGINDLLTCPLNEVEVRRAKIQALREILLKVGELMEMER